MNKLTIKFAFLLTALLGLSACGEGDSGSNVTAEDIRIAETKWRDQSIQDYTFKYSVRCLCPEGEVVVKVRNENLHSADFEGGDSSWRSKPDSDARTITQLFDMAHDARNRAHRVDIQFHSTLGYPVRLDIDWERNLVDDAYKIDVIRMTAE